MCLAFEQNNDSGHVSTNTSDNELEPAEPEEEEEDADEEEAEVDVDDDDELSEEKPTDNTMNAASTAATSAKIHNTSSCTDATPSSTTSKLGVKEIDGISKDNWHLLEKVKSIQRQDHLKGLTFGSPTANDRLMKELRDIFRSENYKNGKIL